MERTGKRISARGNHEGFDRVFGEAFAAAEVDELDEEEHLHDRAAELFDELRGRLGRAARGEQVVDDDDALSRLDGVLVDFDRRLAVFEVVGLFDRFAGQFALFADGNEPRPELVGDRGAEEESARFHAGYDVEIHAGERLRHFVHREAQAFAAVEDARDVAEEDAGFRKIGNAADVVLELFHDAVQGAFGKRESICESPWGFKVRLPLALWGGDGERAFRRVSRCTNGWIGRCVRAFRRGRHRPAAEA